MARHLIVTCGTSQIEDNEKMTALLNKVERSGIRLDRKSFGDFIKSLEVESSDQELPDNWLESTTNASNYANQLANWLANEFAGIEGMVGKPINVFGGELTTLYQMTKSESPAFDPAQDTLALLYSDTKKGAFCAGVLQMLLMHEKVWQIDSKRIKSYRIPELRERYFNIDRADANMHEKILKSRWLGKDNVFVVTGGFKSLLPAATLYAMVFEMPIYYLFEKSDKLWQLEKGWNKVTATGISKLEVTKLSDENNQIEARLKLQTTIPPDVELESKI